MDLAIIAQAATLESRVPFLHFFDGFDTANIYIIDWDNPQFGYCFKLIHSLRTKPVLAKAGNRAFEDAACLETWSWQYSRPHTQVHESYPYSRKCNGNLWRVEFRTRR